MTKVYKLYKIDYDTDGEDLSFDLPKEALVMVEADNDISITGADIISDNTGYLVNDFKFKEVFEDIPSNMKVGSFFTKK